MTELNELDELGLENQHAAAVVGRRGPLERQLLMTDLCRGVYTVLRQISCKDMHNTVGHFAHACQRQDRHLFAITKSHDGRV